MKNIKLKILKILANENFRKITSVAAPRATGILGAAILLKGNKKTSERVDPSEYKTKEEYIIYLRHLFAYKQIEKTNNKNLLEIGCGNGYGAKLLSDSKNVIAIDIDKKVIETAKKQYTNKNLIFEHTNGKVLDFPDNSFDAIISFQTIEHIKFPRLFLIESRRVLKKGGVLFLTTPNRETRLEEGEKPFNRFHIKEYSANEIKETMEEFFKSVKVSGIFGSSEINLIEFKRLKKIKRLVKLDFLGLRKFVPQYLIDFIKGGEEDFDKSKFSLTDFYLSEKDVNSSLDLFVVGVVE